MTNRRRRLTCRQVGCQWYNCGVAPVVARHTRVTQASPEMGAAAKKLALQTRAYDARHLPAAAAMRSGSWRARRARDGEDAPAGRQFGLNHTPTGNDALSE